MSRLKIDVVGIVFAHVSILATCFAVMALNDEAHAITINMHYFNEGDPVPHAENPSWDPDGTILKAHFQAAKAIWEYLLPGGGNYDIDFEWDDDIGSTTLGLTTPGPNLQTLDTLVEINPLQTWFADPTPTMNEEFATTPIQTLYSQLSASDQATYFPSTAPPGALETRYNLTGMAGASGAGGFNAANGLDLLSTIVHELGHVLGVNSEPGDYNIYPQHVGGLENVTVLSGSGGHIAGNGTTPGFLMCDSCGTIGVRRVPTATDVLVVAEDQSIAAVELARVGRISSGIWSEASRWIGGKVPDVTQDVYITHGGNVTVDIDAQAKSLLVAPGNSINTQSGRGINVPRTMTFTGATVGIASAGTLAVNNLVGDPASLTTAIGSLVRFNNFAGNTASTASFGGGLAIGYYTGPTGGLVTYDPSALPTPITTWSVGESLKIGDESQAALIVKNATWSVASSVIVGGNSGSLVVQSSGVMTAGANLDIRANGAVSVEAAATLSVSGNILVGQTATLTYKSDRAASNRPYSIQGGSTAVVTPPLPGVPYLIRTAGGAVTFQDTANAADATVTLEGGTGDGAAAGLMIFKNNSSASTAAFHAKGGHFGPTLPPGFNMIGNGGEVRFEGTSNAGTAVFNNDGVQDTVPVFWQYGGTGGRTIFTADSSADHATIHNHGAITAIGGNFPLGGATHFFSNSSAGYANITNHADAAYIYGGMEARTVFYDTSNAGNATIENEAASLSLNSAGRTEFRGNASAANATINNRGYVSFGGPAGGTFFYDNSTAANATIRTFNGYYDRGRIEFRNQSTAANAHLVIDHEPTLPDRSGGYLYFYDGSTAAQAQITLHETNGVLQFRDNSTAADAQIIAEIDAGSIDFFGISTAANASISLSRGTTSTYWETSTAANASYTLSYGSLLQFQGNSSAGSAQIVVSGSPLSPYSGGTVTFNSNATANNSTITLNGGTAPLGTGAVAAFTNGTHASNSNITANGGTNGGGGARITFDGGATGDTARIIANAGATVDFQSQKFYGDGSTSLGSIEGAGSFLLRGSELKVGTRNINATVSGSISEGSSSGGRLTKLGTGVLTLAGVNTYTGVTTVNAGTLSVTGSIAGDAIVNDGGTLKGTGTIGGTVTVNAGGLLAPGMSPGTITTHGLTMNSGSTLNFELGDPLRDHIVLSNDGSVSLAGTLNISLIGGFAPTLGQSFPLFEGSIGSITGAFQSIIMPTFNGLTFDVIQNANSFVLQVGNAVGVPGDYNNNGTVDAADYIVWRKTDGTQAGYDTWRFHFGQAAGSGVVLPSTGSLLAVPEPSAVLLLILAAAGSLIRRNWVRGERCQFDDLALPTGRFEWRRS